jgi:sarcosine/dimethylglycine N-methyltransferase
VTAEELRSITAQAGFEARVWNDLTDLAVQAMDALLASPPNPLGLQVFVPDLPVKAANLALNLRENRARVVQAVLVAV